MNIFRTPMITTLLALAAVTATLPQAAPAADTPPGPEATAEALHAAIAGGDENRVRRLLAPDVLIFETGGVERSLEEYASHHMHSDMEFMAGVERELLSRVVLGSGDTVVVSSRSRLSGIFREEAVRLLSAETLVMEHSDGSWRVRHIHWSSRPEK